MAAALVAVVYFLPAKEIAVDLVRTIRSYGPVAPVVFFMLYIIAAIIGFPRTVLAILAGIIFTPLTAVIVLMVSMMAAFMATFWLSRHLAADWVAARLESIPIAKALLREVEQNGFKVLALMRMNPFVPAFINGYGFGLTRISPLSYFTASVLGSLPLNMIYIYLGWAGGTAILGDSPDASALQEGTLWAGVALSALLLVAVGWYGRRSIGSVFSQEAAASGTQSNDE